MTFNEFKDIATVIGVAIGAGSLVSAAINIMVTVRTNRAKFWMELRTAFGKHDEVHKKLRPGGEWVNNAGPKNAEDFVQIEAYMGLFEHCEIMMAQKLIDQKTFHEIYDYRLKNLMANNWVRVEKIEKRGKYWKQFIKLLTRMSDIDKEVESKALRNIEKQS